MSAPRPQAEQLIATLERSRAGYIELLALIRTRRASIRSADFAKFSQLGTRETRLVYDIGQLDQARLNEVRGLAMRLALPVEATLADIAARLGAASCRTIERAHGRDLAVRAFSAGACQCVFAWRSCDCWRECDFEPRHP